jgi:hypothetical protein
VPGSEAEPRGLQAIDHVMCFKTWRDHVRHGKDALAHALPEPAAVAADRAEVAADGEEAANGGEPDERARVLAAAEAERAQVPRDAHHGHKGHSVYHGEEVLTWRPSARSSRRRWRSWRRRSSATPCRPS